MRKRATKSTGASLVEVLVAVTLLAIAAVVMSALMPVAARTGKSVGNYQQGLSLVQHKVDQLRGVGWGRLSYDELEGANIIDASPNSQPYTFNEVDGLAGLYSNPVGTISVVDQDTKTKRVTVTLSWTGAAHGPAGGNVEITTLVVKG